MKFLPHNQIYKLWTFYTHSLSISFPGKPFGRTHIKLTQSFKNWFLYSTLPINCVVPRAASLGHFFPLSVQS